MMTTFDGLKPNSDSLLYLAWSVCLFSLSQRAVSPLIPPDEAIYSQHTHQVEELIASCQTVSSSQEVRGERIVVQLEILVLLKTEHLG